ncbi:cation-transporting P-type ATPase 13A2 [Nematocida sp. LUAm3]|nr:cation-transporting P-type ATPase 13A2 [Nematocida sp. LUAm3]KAI5175971.1 cation-transporting P-type ATPase 13A2 [Nematocida sp. LUAm2]KAI5179067.1 cation-transporting P-type ATPase 13A2 [Nematocida sp. LUAm1]
MKEWREESRVLGRRRRYSFWVYYAFCSMSLGSFHLLCQFFPRIRVIFESSSCEMEEADSVDYKGKLYKVYREKVLEEEVSDLLYEYIRKEWYQYIYIGHKRKIFNWSNRRYEVPRFQGSMELLNRKEKEIFYGRNKLFMEVDGNWLVLFNILFNGVNLYTLFGIALWIGIDYIIYAILIFILMLYNVVSEYKKEIMRNERVREVIRKQKSVYLLVEGGCIGISPFDVVIGDLLVVVPFSEVPCDCVVVDGTLAVDEGFITGECVPVLKKRESEVLGGTVVVQALCDGGEGIECLEIGKYLENGHFSVIRATKISFDSAKGKAFKNILKQKTSSPIVYYDTLKLLFFTGVASIPILGWLLIIMLRNGYGIFIGSCYFLDLLYAIVSPSLPTSIWVGMSVCAQRLLKKKVVCNDLSVTNISGNISMVCFDKTGTLTEEGLNIKCVYADGREVHAANELSGEVLRGLHSCHSIEVIDGKYLGDPLDLILFSFSGSKITYQLTDKGRYKFIESSGMPSARVERVYEFDPNTRRMGVSVSCEEERYFFCKGAPESIKPLCNVKNFPKNFDRKIEEYYLNGYRVIALAGKKQGNPGELKELETELDLLSIIVFENKLKKETEKTIAALTHSGVKSVMCTGDSLLTAISVSVKCGIIERHVPVVYPVLPNKPIISPEEIDWFCKSQDDVIFDKMIMKVRKGKDYSSYMDFVVAVDGESFDLLIKSSDYRSLIKKRCKIFARMNPSQKGTVVKIFKENELVCFVGDGANDCIAIQAADVSLSISSEDSGASEFSVASYLSRNPEISSVLNVLSEGKCAIVTTINKIKQIYILILTQFFALSLMQYHLIFFSDRQTIYSDILICIPLGVIMSGFTANRKMTKKRPKFRLFTRKNVFSLFSHAFIHLLHLLICIWILEYFEHTSILKSNQKNLSEISQIGTGLFFLFNCQILYSGFCYTSGEPFRQKRAKNLYFLLFYLFHILMLSFLLVSVSGMYFNTPNPQSTLSYPNFLCELLHLLPLSVPAGIGIISLCVSDALLIQMLTRIGKALLQE